MQDNDLYSTKIYQNGCNGSGSCGCGCGCGCGNNVGPAPKFCAVSTEDAAATLSPKELAKPSIRVEAV